MTTVKWNRLGHTVGWGYPILVDAGDDETGQSDGSVKLVAYYTPRQTMIPSKGAVILLHGWEGCSHSNYNLATMRVLLRAGYDVIRLNLRDHGPGFHAHPQALNPGVFLGTLLAETIAAITACAEMVRPRPVYVVGFSIGGNFALRSAIRHAEGSIPNLRQVIAVNPAINPLWSTLRIDQNPVVRRHFRAPWLAALREKQRFYPERYDFEPIQDLASQVPTLIITALDDMVVPVADIYGLAPSPNLKIDIHPHGGHVGFVDGLPPTHKVGELVLRGMESG